MNLHKKTLAIFLAATLSVSAFSANSAPAKAPKKQSVDQIESDVAKPINENTGLASFEYDPNLAYEILTRDGLYTHIEMPAGEKVLGFYPSDTTRWRSHVAGNQERIFMKPTLPGLFNSATLVTNKRVYELTFRSGKSGDPWYQRVRWSGEGEDAPSEFTEMAGNPISRKAQPFSQVSDSYGDVSPFQAGNSFRGEGQGYIGGVSPSSLNFAYSITGDGPFKPSMVFDDGKFTWIQLGNRPEMPALFGLKKDGKVEVLNYTVHGNYLKVTQLVDSLLMKLGPDEVKISRKAPCSGFFGCRNE